MIELIITSIDGRLLVKSETLDAVAKTFGDCELSVFFDKKSENKNRKQIGFYFAAIVKGAADYFGWSPDDMHSHLKEVCNKKELVDKNGEVSYIGASTRPLSKREYAEFVNRCIVYLADKGYDCGEPIRTEDANTV